MLEIERRAITQTLNLLKGIGARFKIILPNGEEFGELEVKNTQRTRRAGKFPMGEISSYFKPFVTVLQAGECAEIPAKGYGRSLQNSLTGWASKEWGKESYITSFNQETNVLTILRSL